jgi:hypothetical protein
MKDQVASFSRFAWLRLSLVMLVGSLSIEPSCVQGQQRDTAQAETAPEPIKVEATTKAELNEAIQRGVDFLLSDQNRDGSWGSATLTKDLNIYAPTPGAHHGYRSAVTALCVLALVEVSKKHVSEQASEATNKAIESGETWLLEHLPTLRRANQDTLYNIWGHAYGIQALVKLVERLDAESPKRKRLIEEIVRQVELLDRYESVHGGWGYYDFAFHLKKPSTDPNSFTTATVLFAFHEAQRIGVEVPQRLIDRGLGVIKRQQRPDLAYLYSETFRTSPGAVINKPGGSVGRSQACNLVLRLYGDDSVSDAALKAWANRLFSRNLWLDIGRKRPIPHESWFLVAGYFFYYGHYYAAYCIDLLPEADRPELQQQLMHVMLRLQEKDGSWWDYPLYNYHQQYGTAFALLTLERCASAALDERP